MRIMIRDGKTARAFLCALHCNDSAGLGRKTNYFLPYIHPPFLNNNARLCIQLLDKLRHFRFF
ncbi:hypothetical protein KsCSTR_09960 [Candidatus Kuenenia stuttgartiensis]|uniref:Uncharacterized protein n=1 Tax=Kuenenia stuttgartiensis TaxID=174633 RepID=Q1PYU3_KUEST|nr:hypothetical protein KsCSTR_09960 [Candidatus Kuenenia stuttgartiensis]CAJ72260.1 unknown protein [Candidatus Kuenenia stuttgartiensis]